MDRARIAGYIEEGFRTQQLAPPRCAGRIAHGFDSVWFSSSENKLLLNHGVTASYLFSNRFVAEFQGQRADGFLSEHGAF